MSQIRYIVINLKIIMIELARLLHSHVLYRIVIVFLLI